MFHTVMRSVGPMLAGLALLVSINTAAQAEKRLALVVGEDAYQEVPKLAKAVNDARAVGDALGTLGFQVDLVENATRSTLSRKLTDFEGFIQPGDTVFFFFAGHGFEIRGDNYLLPVDVPEAREGQEGLVRDASFAARDVTDRLQARGAGVVIAVLDACRDNPFQRPGTRAVAGTRGLSLVPPSEGVFMLMSAGAKQAALDELSTSDPNPNSVFTRTFITQLTTPGKSLVEIAKDTQSEVKSIAAQIRYEQTPAYYDQINGNFYFQKPALVATNGPASVPATQVISPSPAGATPALDPRLAEAGMVWPTIQATTSIDVLRVFQSRYSGTIYADLAAARISELQRVADLPPAGPAAKSPTNPSSLLPPVAPQPVIAFDKQAFIDGVTKQWVVTQNPNVPGKIFVHRTSTPQALIDMLYEIKVETDGTWTVFRAGEFTSGRPLGNVARPRGITIGPCTCR